MGRELFVESEGQELYTIRPEPLEGLSVLGVVVPHLVSASKDFDHGG